MPDGIPSPNPTFKQDIHNVSGDVEEIIENKNLFDIEDGTYYLAGSQSTYLTFKDGVGRLTLGSTGIEVGIGIPLKNSVVLKANQSSTRTTFNNSNYPYINLYNGSTKVEGMSSSDRGIKSYTPTEDIIFNRIFIYFGIVNTNNFGDIKPMMTVGEYTAQTMPPHQGQTLPFTLSQGQKMYAGDYLADDGIHHVRGQEVLNGNETGINTDGATANYRRFTIPKTNFLNIKDGVAISSHFKYVSNYNLDEPHFYIGANSLIFFALNPSATTNDFKTWLNENNVSVEYELAEEVIDPYTTTQQAQYNAIKKAISHKGTTIITLSSNDADPLTNVVAVADMSNFNPSEIDEIKTAIVALGGVI